MPGKRSPDEPQTGHWTGPVWTVAISQDDKTSLECAERCRQALSSYRHAVHQEKGSIVARLRAAFLSNHAIIAIGSAAILMRTLGPLCQSKAIDPPVLCLSPDGGSIVVLLGAAVGGSVLARDLASPLESLVCGEGPATRVRYNNCPPGNGDKDHGKHYPDTPLGHNHGWRWCPGIQDHLLYRALRNNQVRVDLEPGLNLRDLPSALSHIKAPIVPEADKSRRETGTQQVQNDGSIRVVCTLRPGPITPYDYCLHPPMVTLGLGFIRYANPEECWTWVSNALSNANIARESIAAVASIVEKADEPALGFIARQLNRPLRYFTADELQTMEPYIASPSAYVKEIMGTPSVAEASALMLAGTGSKLIQHKLRCRLATLALALARAPLLPDDLPGIKPGSVTVTGIGPGHRSCLTFAACESLDQCDALFGYHGYVNRLTSLFPDVPVHAYPIGAEEERVRACLEFAALGHKAVLVCSGDPSIYGMASLVFEVRHTHLNALVRGVTIMVEPGITAMQMASARVGGLLNHDFCAISLSDLLTPREKILERIEATAKADMVIAFYNPQSARRRDLLPQAISILKRYRKGDCPIVVARHLAQEKEHVATVELGHFSPADVDMHTIVICGNNQTRRLDSVDGIRVATPRGYI